MNTSVTPIANLSLKDLKNIKPVCQLTDFVNLYSAKKLAFIIQFRMTLRQVLRNENLTETLESVLDSYLNSFKGSDLIRVNQFSEYKLAHTHYKLENESVSLSSLSLIKFFTFLDILSDAKLELDTVKDGEFRNLLIKSNDPGDAELLNIFIAPMTSGFSLLDILKAEVVIPSESEEVIVSYVQTFKHLILTSRFASGFKKDEN